MSDEDRELPLKRKRGRPRVIEEDAIFCILDENKHRLSPDNGQTIVSKHDNVWGDIACSFNSEKSPYALYTYVVCNKDKIREKLWKEYNMVNEQIFEDLDISIAEELIQNSTLDSTVEDKSNFSFTIHVPANDFDKLVETRLILKGKRKKRVEMKKFRKDEWQDFVTQKIWNNTRLKCGYNFKYHYLNQDVTSGHFVGACNCGSKIECRIERNEDNVVAISCSTTKGDTNKQCGKRGVRGLIREGVGDKMQSKSAHVFRAILADELMDEEDPEPPHLPKTTTLRQIKHEIAKSKFLDSDPIVALEILSTYDMEGEIPWIGHKPFFVHYSTKLQRNVYTKISKTEHLCLAIDSTGSIIQPIKRVDKKKSGPIFLYIAVISTSSGQLPVAQMITERHTTGSVHFWLSQWVAQWGLAPPEEIVCDQSVALLSAAVREFTSKKTINEYADAFFGADLPPCYIRIDVAHYIKLWTNVLQLLRCEVAKFFKAGIGKIILCRNLEDARKIITALLTVAYSKTCGKMVDENISACGKATEFLKHVLETAEINEFVAEFEHSVSSDTATDNESHEIGTRQASKAEPSLWRNWASELRESVMENIENNEGTDINPHWAPQFADRLVTESKWLPLWSCIFRDRFGFGRCPASSAPVEAEFGTIKRLMLKGLNVPLRVDEFVRVHKKYLDGTSKTIVAHVNSQASTVERGQGTMEYDEGEESEASLEDYSVDINGNTESFAELNSSAIVDQSNCPACKNGDMPGGAHRCMICERGVHAIEPCSVPASDSDEGFGQKRVCFSCMAKPNAAPLIESRAHENWRNKVVAHEKKQSRGKYLQETYPVNEFLLTDALPAIPILKSGAEATLKPVNREGSSIDVSRTCAFDSIFQLILTAAFDSPDFLENVVRKYMDKNPFMRLIDATRVRSITAATYRARAEILAEHFDKTGHAEMNCFVIQCETTVASMGRKLLTKASSFIEETVCTGKCLRTIKQFPLLAVNLKAILSREYDRRIYEEIVIQPERRCASEGCTGTVTSELRCEGFVLLEVISETDRDTVKLDEIPKKIKLANMSREMILRGIVHFEAPPMVRRMRKIDSTNSIGHYTAYCLRNGFWSQYDKKLKKRSEASKVCPQLVLYTA